MRFSNPLPSSCESGKLSGSAHTRSSRGCASAVTQSRPKKNNALRQAEDIEHSSCRRHVRQVLHGIDAAQSRAALAGVEITRNHGAGLHLDVRTYIGRTGDIASLGGEAVLTEVLMGNVEQFRARRPGARLPILRAGRSRADVTNHLTNPWNFLGVVAECAARRIHAQSGRDMYERVSGKHFTGGAIHHVHVAVALRTQERLAQSAADRRIDEHAFIDAVVIVQVVRARLIEPDRIAVIGPAREDAARPFVGSRPLLGIPWPGIPGAVIDEIELRVVGDPAPDRAPSDLPRLRGPGLHAEILAAILTVKGLERGADEHLLVGAGAVGAPDLLAAGGVERREPAADSELSAAVADQHLALYHERRHRDRLSELNFSKLRAPQLLPARRLDRYRMIVERVEEQAPLGIDCAAIDNIAARNALRTGVGLGIELPLNIRAGLREIEREDVIGVRRNHVHGVADHDRRRFVAFLDTCRKAERKLELARVGGRNLVEGTESRISVIARRHAPFGAVVQGIRRNLGNSPHQHGKNYRAGNDSWHLVLRLSVSVGSTYISTVPARCGVERPTSYWLMAGSSFSSGSEIS